MGTDTQCVMLRGLQARAGWRLHSVSGAVAQCWSGWVEASRRTLGTVTSRQTPRDTGEHTSRDTGAQLLDTGEGVMKNDVDVVNIYLQYLWHITDHSRYLSSS